MNNAIFELLTFLIQLSNMSILLTDYYDVNDSNHETLADSKYLDYAYVFIFIIEVFIRVLAQRNHEYIKEAFNIFDLSLVVAVVLQVCFPTHLRIITFIRQIRILRLSYFQTVFVGIK